MNKYSKLLVQDTEISITTIGNEDYICLTDMVKAQEGEFFISDWIRNANTLDYLAGWEQIYNPDFNYGEFAIIRSGAGSNNFKVSIKELKEKTNIISIRATTGRYGGTYAHKDIAFHFAMWLSPEFQIYLVNEFQRLKNEENDRLKLEWNLQRTLAKVNYRIHTDAIKENLIPVEITKHQAGFVYANEADLLNVALFGITAKEWRENNNNEKGNIRDYASIEQLIILSNLESINSILIKQQLKQNERLIQLNKIAISQMQSLLNSNAIKKLNNL